MTPLKNSLKNGCFSQFTKKALEKIDHYEVSEDNWTDIKYPWLKYVENDVLCTVFCYARYSKRMEAFTGFEIKITLT